MADAKPDVRELIAKMDALYETARHPTSYGEYVGAQHDLSRLLVTAEMSECVTHHYACDCREAKLAEEIAQLRREKEESGRARENLSHVADELEIKLAQRDATIKAVREMCEREGPVPVILTDVHHRILALLDREQT